MNQHKVLIVDDTPLNIQVLGSVLREAKYQVGFANNGKQALEILHQSNDFDIVLLDIDMPILDGYQTCSMIRSTEKLKDIPVIFLTAYVEEENIVKGFDLGAQDYVLKPFNARELLARIDTHIQLKEKSAQLKKMNQLLEMKVEERTAELEKTNIELTIAKQHAEEMNRVKNYFLSNMSHELRTPLISVLGFAELLQNEITNQEHLEMINRIMEGGQRLNNTLYGILELSKLESLQSSLNLQPCNLADQINTRVKSFLPMAQSKRLYLKSEFSDTHLQANIDSELFGKALYHLVYNGIKFTKEGGVFVSLIHENNQDRDWAVTKVIDTGIGIPKEDFEKIYGAFRQSSEGHSRSHEGTGIGLTITKRIVELMKGKIEVESEIGKGSVFSIWLPAILDESHINKKVEELRKKTIIEPPTIKERGLQKVLLVEDNPDNRLLIKLCLASKVRIIEAEDGIKGVTLASKEKFDLILMDINLGAGIDGVEAMHQIRKIPGYIRVPIIAVTAYVMFGDKERFLNEGFDEYLGKPFSKESLISLVEKTLAKVK